MTNSEMPTSYAKDILPLFRPKDINSMRAFGGFDLGTYADVRDNAESIYQRLLDGSMPCDGAWPQTQIDLFKSWIDAGKQP